MTSFVHFKYLPTSVKILYTMILLVFGVGYLFALVNVFLSDAGKDGDPMLSAKDLMITYGGNPEGTKLETALRGPMQDMLPEEKRKVLIEWLHTGAKPEVFESVIAPVIQEHCVACHTPEANPHLTDLRTFEGVAKVAARDEGMNLSTLVRVSHIHLFGIAFIFYILGKIYAHAWVRPVWIKYVTIAAPLVVVLTDVGSWYLTKFWPGFAWVVIGSGAVMGLSFAVMWITCMHQLWFFRPPPELAQRQGALPDAARV